MVGMRRKDQERSRDTQREYYFLHNGRI
jgi:hypothetical protein